MTRLAHLSDLHLGASPAHAVAFDSLVRGLLEHQVDHVLITGDLTHSGKAWQLELYERLVEPLRAHSLVTVVPGNHDRCNDDVGKRLRGPERVSVVQHQGLYLVRVDSTASHNKHFFLSHGDVCQHVLAQVDEALSKAPPMHTVCIALHHHVVPLPAEDFWEWFSTTFHLGWAAELRLGAELLSLARGRCDLVLHGHRHHPKRFVVDAEGPRPLHIYNAGSSVELAAFRVFELAGGHVHQPQWAHSKVAVRTQGAPTKTASDPALELRLA